MILLLKLTRSMDHLSGEVDSKVPESFRPLQADDGHARAGRAAVAVIWATFWA